MAKRKTKKQTPAEALAALAEPDRRVVEQLAAALELTPEAFWKAFAKPARRGGDDAVEVREGRLIRLPLQRKERIVGDKLRLDLRELSALEELRAPRWRIEALELPPSLRRLDACWNCMHDLALEGLTELEELRVELAIMRLDDDAPPPTVDLSRCAGLRVANVGRLLATEVRLPDPSRLEELRVHVNALERVVLPPSLELRVFDCSGNRAVRGDPRVLAEVDVRGAPALEQLVCGYNGLRDLRLPSPAAALTLLSCPSNDLTRLPSAAEAPALETLECWSNPLGALDLAGRDRLRTLDAACVGLRELDLSGAAGLTFLNVTAQPPVSVFDPERLNRLEALDLSATPALEVLHVGGNPLGTLDLTGLRRLHTLTVGEVGDLRCTDRQRESILALRYRFGLSKPARSWKKHDPWQLHDVARQLNWDDGTKLAKKILKHPSCDLGTALWLYWHADPHFYTAYPERKKVPAHARKGWDLVKAIEEQVAQGAFAQARIPFDPRCDRSQSATGHDWTTPSRRVETAWEIPEIMKQAVGAEESP